MAYTTDEIHARLERAAADIALLYQDDCINYRGKTADTGAYYSEVAAAWLLEHLDLLEQIPKITRRASYYVPGHDGNPAHPGSNRREELTAMAMYRQGTLPLLGRVLDYQTPLKDVQKDRAGKIDLLTWDGTTLRILELKAPNSRETMLRCVLEGYTYRKTLDGDKLLADFAPLGLPAHANIQACPLVFYGGSQWREMRQERPCLKLLMAALHSTPYYIHDLQGAYTVTQ